MGNTGRSDDKFDAVQVIEVCNPVDHTARSRASYAPLVTKWPFLLSICGIVLACIAILQVALNNSVPLGSYPPQTVAKRGFVQYTTVINGQTLTVAEFVRESTTSVPSATTVPLSATGSGITTVPLSATGSGTTTVPLSITDSGTTTATSTASEDGSTTTTGPSNVVTVSQAAPNRYVSIGEVTAPSPQSETDSQDTLTGQPAPNSYITVPPGQPGPNSYIATVTDPNVLPSIPVSLLTVTSGVPLTDSKGEVVPTLIYSDGQLVSSPAPVSYAPSTIYSSAVVVATVSAPSTVYSDGVAVATVIAPSTVYSESIAISSITPPPQAVSTSKSAEYITFLSSVTGANGEISSVVVVATKPSTTTIPSQGVPGVIDSLHGGPIMQMPVTFRPVHYFLSMYLCTFVAVFIKILWACVYGANKMMEPFYQLNKPGGASARESLMADYLSSGLSWWSLKIIFGGHWVMILTLTTAALVAILPPLATESMSIKAMSICLLSDGLEHPCNPVWVLNVNMIRVLQTMLALIAFCIIVIVILGLRRRSGINANPSSIVTMATLLHHPDVLAEIRNIHENHSREEIQAILGHNRYQITSYMDDRGQEHIGLAKANVSFDPVGDGPLSSDNSNTNRQGSTPQYVQLANPTFQPPAADHPHTHDRLHLILNCILAVFLVSLLILVLRYWVETWQTPFNDFFNSDSFGPRFILTSACSVVSMVWLDIEREVRIRTPLRALIRGNASPQTTIMASVDGSPHISLAGSLMRRNWFHFAVAVAAVCSDILTVAISGVAYSSSQVRTAYVVSTWLTVGLTLYMLAVVLGVFYWRWSNARIGMPKLPNETLLSVWMSLANKDNQIRQMMAGGWSVIDQKQRDQYVLSHTSTYWAGWVEENEVSGADGSSTSAPARQRWCVDGEGYVPQNQQQENTKEASRPKRKEWDSIDTTSSSSTPKYNEATHAYHGHDASTL